MYHPGIHDPVLTFRVQALFKNSWSATTHRTYASGIKRFIQFCLSQGIVTPRTPLVPTSETTLVYFVTQISSTLSYATIKNYLVGVAHLHVLFQLPIKMTYLKQILKAVKRSRGQLKRIRRDRKSVV